MGHKGSEIRNLLQAAAADPAMQRAVVSKIKDAVIDVLAAYSGARADSTYDGVFTECVALMTHKFPMFTVADIKEAYRLLACGEYDVNYAAYGGAATVTAFGQVMAAYKEVKDRYNFELQKKAQEEERLKKEKENAENEERKSEYEKEVKKWYFDNKLKSGEGLTIQKIPWYYFDTIRKFGYINPSAGAKQECEIEAMKIVEQGIKDKTTRERYEFSLLGLIRDRGYSEAVSSADHRIKSEVISLAKRIYLHKHFRSNGTYE
jgi:hypothetical protein